MEEKNVEKQTIFVKAKKKIKEKTDKAKETAGNIFHFFAEHPEVTQAVFSGLATLGFGGIMAASRAGKQRLEACRVDDDITGERFLVEHPLTNDEILELNQRMSCGESKASALESMGLLR